MRFLAAFRAESAAQDRWRAAIRSFAWLLLALFPWLLSLGGNAHEVPKFSEAALAPCLAATILLARWLYEDAGEKRRFHWLLPDADEAWILLEPTLRSEAHTSELQSLMRISYAVFGLKKKTQN